MGTLISLVVALIIVAVICWIIQLIPIPAGAPWIKTVAFVLVALVFLVWLAGFFGYGGDFPFHGPGWRR